MNQNQVPTPNRRSFFRVYYNGDYHPTLAFTGLRYTVLDVCEVGIRFFYSPKRKLPIDLFQAIVTFQDGSLPVTGRILRITGDFAVMKLIGKTIPYQRVLNEQSYLRRMEIK